MKRITYSNEVVLHAKSLRELSQRTASVFQNPITRFYLQALTNREPKASMFYCFPTSSGLRTLLEIVAKMIHISSFILLLLLHTNKSILGNLMKQYVLGGSLEDSEYMTIFFNAGGFCVKQMGVNRITSSQIGQRLPHMYLNHTNACGSCDCGDAPSGYLRGFLCGPAVVGTIQTAAELLELRDFLEFVCLSPQEVETVAVKKTAREKGI